MDNYPPGAAHDPNAPWNQSDPKEKEFDLHCYQTIDKVMPIFSTDYIEEVDEEYDDEGHKFRTCVYSTNDIDWAEEFKNNGYHTPLELLGLFKQYLNDIQNNTKNANYNPWEIKHLIAECEDWQESETIYEEG